MKRPKFRTAFISLLAAGIALLLTQFNLSLDRELIEDSLEESIPVYTDDTIESGSSVGGVISTVIDGDTVVLQTRGREERVRVIGIDTPEVAGSPAGAECFGAEASSYARELLLSQSVTVTTDASQDLYDSYGRLLGYIEIEGKDFGREMLQGGYATEFTYARPYVKQAQYRSAENIAKEAKTGLWSVCDY